MFRPSHHARRFRERTYAVDPAGVPAGNKSDADNNLGKYAALNLVPKVIQCDQTFVLVTSIMLPVKK
jgi:hypothetical protein